MVAANPTPHPSAKADTFLACGRGHGLALTAHCAVIHYQTAASLPTGEGKEAAVSLPPGGGLHFRAGAGTYIKAPLCKGGCRRNVDWGIVLHLPKIPEAHKSVQQSSVTAGAVPRVSLRLGHGPALRATGTHSLPARRYATLYTRGAFIGAGRVKCEKSHRDFFACSPFTQGGLS